jgi:acetoin utilization deacetylase AcuC-like enzyme
MLPGKIIYSPDYFVQLEHHVYPTEKYLLVKEKLIREGLVEECDFLEPSLPSKETLLEIHEASFLEDLDNLRMTPRTWRAELPLTRGTVRSALMAVSGTVLAVQEALRSGVGIHLGGGHHHAFPDHAEGFCFLNDVALGVLAALKGGASRVAVVDCDLHQGNGTAAIFRGHPHVFTFSIHEEDIYPPKEKSSLDIGLPAGAGDQEYLVGLQEGLSQVFAAHPDFVVFVGGTDPYRGDKLGLLELSPEGLLQRDTMVLESCFKRHIPFVTTFSGGYAMQIEDTIELHSQTVRLAIGLLLH